MIFQHMLDKVLGGTKRQTRRLVKEGETCHYVGGHINKVLTAQGRIKYQVGRTYAVQPGRCKPAVTRIKILKIRRERASAITWPDANEEGCHHPVDFLGLWERIHGHEKLNWLVWVYDFELVKTE
jgi:hypothetical protein